MEQFDSVKKGNLQLIGWIVVGICLFFTFVVAIIALGLGGRAYHLTKDDSDSGDGTNIPLQTVSSLSSTPPTGYMSIGAPTIISGWTYTTLAPLPFARSDHSAVTIGNSIYVLGGTGTNGEGSSPTTNVNDVYNPITNTWTRKASMNFARYRFAAATLGTKIYVMGGRSRDDDNVLASLEVYDSTTDSWELKANMSIPRSDHTAFTINGLIYVTGGYDGDYNIYNSTIKYDPVADQWSNASSLNIARGDVMGVAYNGKGFVTGGWGYPGFTLLNTLEEYDPVADEWTVKEGFLPHMGGDKGFATINAQFILIGGEGEENTDSKPLHYVDLYDMNTGIWNSRAPLPFPALRMACSSWTNASNQTMVYCFGGEECPEGDNIACLLDGATAEAKDIATTSSYTEYSVYNYVLSSDA